MITRSKSRSRAGVRVAGLLVLALGVLAPSVWAQGPTPPAPGGRGGAPPDPLPLKPTRKAEFSATKGTWLSLDVSPDGKIVVFDLLGDIYTMPIAGGKATRITSGIAFDAQPRFSPDGKKIVFVSDKSGGDNVYTMTLDQRDTVQITQGNNSLYVSPDWSPDGNYIVVSRSVGLGGAAKLQVHHVDGRAPMPLIRGSAALKTLGAAWSPDGRYIWYAARNGDWQYNALFPQYQLFVYDRELGTSTLMTNRYGSGFRPAISPDGKWLVYGTRDNAETGLRIRDLATGEEDWLIFPVQRDDMESRAPLDVLPGYSFTPDSKAVVLSHGGEIWRVPVDKTAPSKIAFQADVKLDIGPEVKFAYRVDTTTAVTAKQIRNPVPSPDGKTIAFTAFDRIWVKDLPNGTPRRLTTAEVSEHHPVWSPDGRSIAFVTWNDQTGGHIMKASVAGPARGQQLTQAPALYYNLAWSPDGGRIVASRGAARELLEAPSTFFGPLGGEFVWVPAAGGALTVIAPTGTRDVAHFRSDEPTRIYAYSPVEGLVSFRWDGTDVKQHLRVLAPPPPGAGNPHPEEYQVLPRRVFPFIRDLASQPAEPAEPPGAPQAGLVMIAPKGDFALAQINNDIYTVMIPKLGGPVPSISVAGAPNGPVPMRKLTDIGGEFPVWSSDGNKVHWAIGNALVSYDLARVKFVEDSTKAALLAKKDTANMVRAKLDTLKSTRARVDSLTKANAPVPDSLKKKLNALRADSVKLKADSLLARIDALRAQADSIKAKADSVRMGLDTVKADSTPGYKPQEQRIYVTMGRDVPRSTIVLRGGRVLTMKGKEILENADVLIRDNRIVAVGKRDSVQVPADAKVIDVTGKTLLPGFVDTHYHAQWLVPEIHVNQTWQYLTTLAYGVTTTRDPQTSSTDVLSYQDRVETGGMLGPRIYSTGPGVFQGENIRNLDHAKKVLKRYSDYYDTKTLKMYMSGNRQQRQWIIQAAKELQLMPTTEGGLDLKLELTHAFDGYSGIEHSLPVAPLFDDVVELFKGSQTTNSPTLLVSYGGPFGENYFYTKEEVHDDAKMRRFMPEDALDTRTRRRGPGAGGSPGGIGWALDEEYVFPKHAQFVKNLIEKGARAAVGSHGQIQGIGYHWEMWAMGSGGLANHDVLRAATIYGAEAIGFDKDVGTIEAGKLADILVLDKDPLADLRNTNSLRYVMKNGRLYDANTLDEVAPRARPLARQYWQEMAPTGVRAGIR
ncbi:MAG TPA: amidohydrolase family protein [Longimicrobiales bacterium]|nr:amidohydrolase family protein [Longimicrobiales bacterium]